MRCNDSGLADLVAAKPRNSDRSGRESTCSQAPTQLAVNRLRETCAGNPGQKHSGGQRTTNCPLSSYCRSTSAETWKKLPSCDSSELECFRRCSFLGWGKCSNKGRSRMEPSESPRICSGKCRPAL